MLASLASCALSRQDLRASSRGRISTYSELLAEAERQHEAQAVQEDEVECEEEDEQVQTPSKRGLQLPTDLMNSATAKTAEKRQAKASDGKRGKPSQPQM